MIHGNVILELPYRHCTVMVEIKKTIYRLLSKHLLQRKQEHSSLKELQSNDNFYEKLPVTYIEASCSNNIHTGVKFFCGRYF